jgi:DNA-binding HxlR family transcriptional regulator
MLRHSPPYSPATPRYRVTVLQTSLRQVLADMAAGEEVITA